MYLLIIYNYNIVYITNIIIYILLNTVKWLKLICMYNIIRCLIFHLWFADGNPDAEDVFDDEDIIPPLSPTGEWKRVKFFHKNHRNIDFFLLPNFIYSVQTSIHMYNIYTYTYVVFSYIVCVVPEAMWIKSQDFRVAPAGARGIFGIPWGHP